MLIPNTKWARGRHRSHTQQRCLRSHFKPSWKHSKHLVSLTISPSTLKVPIFCVANAYHLHESQPTNTVTDVTGGEFHAMKNFDFGRYKFLVLSIERPSERLHHLLCSHGYWVLTQLNTFGECFYVHHSLPGFKGQMDAYRPQFSSTWLWENHTYMDTPAWIVT